MLFNIVLTTIVNFQTGNVCVFYKCNQIINGGFNDER